MGHKIEKISAKTKKNIGKATGNRSLQMKGAIEETSAKVKDKFD